jgi:hypothetical protein
MNIAYAEPNKRRLAGVARPDMVYETSAIDERIAAPPSPIDQIV